MLRTLSQFVLHRLKSTGLAERWSGKPYKVIELPGLVPEAMRNLQALQSRVLLKLSLMAMLGMSLARADFHVVNWRHFIATPPYQFNGLKVVPSNNFGCSGVPLSQIASGTYPSCTSGWLTIPAGQCGSGALTIRPACNTTYFGTLNDGSGAQQGYCNWNDSGNTPVFSCNLSITGGDRAYDRLLCYTSVCG